MESEERFFVTDRARWRQLVPWLHLFRGFRIAFRGRPILLAIIAVLLIDAGQQVIEALPFSTGSAGADHEWGHAFDESRRAAAAVDVQQLSSEPVSVVVGSARNGIHEIVRPLWTVVRPASILFERGKTWGESAVAWTEVLWALVVWGLFGVAITRTSAMRFAVDEAPSLRESLRYSSGKLISSMAAPLLPMVGVLVLWLICLTLGLFGRIPGVGPLIVGVSFGIPLLLAAFMTLILLIVGAGWPLMLASIGTEDADGFDAFSRVYSYLYSRPWYALWMAVVALAYGSLLVAFLVTATEIMVPLAEWAVASGMGDANMDRLLADRGSEAAAAATSVVEFWRRLVGLVLTGFVISYFWTATTIVYFLLRHSVDATALDSIARRMMDPMKAKSDEMPLVGVAAAEQREQMPSDMPGSE